MTVELKLRQRSDVSPPGIEILRLEKEPVWEMLSSTPYIGVAVVSDEPRVLWCNKRAAEIFGGEGTEPSHFIGQLFADRFPPGWTEERMRVFRTVRETGSPVMLRTVWDGRQQISCIRQLNDPNESPDEELDEADDGYNQFLVVTQRMDTDQMREALGADAEGLIESGYVRLGVLDRLTGRELEVLALLGQGLAIKEIAAILHRSVKTIDNHRQSIGRKLHAADRTELVNLARHAGLTIEDAQRKRV